MKKSHSDGINNLEIQSTPMEMEHMVWPLKPLLLGYCLSAREPKVSVL